LSEESKELIKTNKSREIQAADITEDNLETYQRQQFIKEVPDLMEVTFKKLKEQISNGDKNALKMGLEVLNFIKAGGGLTIQTNTYNQTLNASKNNGETFASIVKNLDNVRSKPKKNDDSIIDAEIVG
jgi:hypothetical protein